MNRRPTVPLADLAVSVDYGVTASATYQSDGPKFLRITDIQNGSVDWNSVPRCAARSRGLSDAELRSGDIVFARTGATTGKSFLIRECPRDAVFASYLIRVRLMNTVEPRFVSHFFQTPEYWAQITQTVRGVAQPGVNATTLRTLRIPLPPLNEQKRIAEVLDKADVLRARRLTALGQLHTLRQAIFVDMFGDPETNPKGWPDKTTLGELAEIVSGVTKGRSVNGNTVRSVPYLAVSNVQDRALDLSVVKRIDATPEEIERLRLRRDDLLLTEGGDPDKLGRGTLWAEQLPDCIHQNHVFRVRLKTAAVHPVFLNWLVGSSRGKRYFLKSAKQTTGIASINMTQLRRFPLLIPPIQLQESFVRISSGAQDQADSHRRSLRGLDALFASLQYRAFRGEL